MNESLEGGTFPEMIQGRYTNYCRVGQNAMEFVVDFGERYGEQGVPLFHTRIVSTPTYMRAIVAALEEAIELHARRFPDRREGA